MPYDDGPNLGEDYARGCMGCLLILLCCLLIDLAFIWLVVSIVQAIIG